MNENELTALEGNRPVPNFDAVAEAREEEEAAWEEMALQDAIERRKIAGLEAIQRSLMHDGLW